MLKAENIAVACYLYFWHRNIIYSLKEFVSTTYSFISLVLAESVIGFIYIDKVVLLIPNQCCSTPQQILGQR